MLAGGRDGLAKGLVKCPANNFDLMPYRLGAQVAQRGATWDGLPGLGPAMTNSVGHALT